LRKFRKLSLSASVAAPAAAAVAVAVAVDPFCAPSWECPTEAAVAFGAAEAFAKERGGKRGDSDEEDVEKEGGVVPE
jgi:hypothetical protein